MTRPVLCQVNMATRLVECSIFGLQPLPRGLADPSCSAALLLPGGGELVTAAPNASLQFYSLAQDRHIDRLQVCTAAAGITNEQTLQCSMTACAASAFTMLRLSVGIDLIHPVAFFWSHQRELRLLILSGMMLTAADPHSHQLHACWYPSVTGPVF